MPRKFPYWPILGRRKQKPGFLMYIFSGVYMQSFVGTVHIFTVHFCVLGSGHDEMAGRNAQSYRDRGPGGGLPGARQAGRIQAGRLAPDLVCHNLVIRN